MLFYGKYQLVVPRHASFRSFFIVSIFTSYIFCNLLTPFSSLLPHPLFCVQIIFISLFFHDLSFYSTDRHSNSAQIFYHSTFFFSIGRIDILGLPHLQKDYLISVSFFIQLLSVVAYLEYQASIFYVFIPYFFFPTQT